jgi:hypothetical protein
MRRYSDKLGRLSKSAFSCLISQLFTTTWDKNRQKLLNSLEVALGEYRLTTCVDLVSTTDKDTDTISQTIEQKSWLNEPRAIIIAAIITALVTIIVTLVTVSITTGGNRSDSGSDLQNEITPTSPTFDVLGTQEATEELIITVEVTAEP